MRIAPSLALLLLAAPASAAELTINVSGLRSADGEVGCALHADAQTFPGGSPFRTVWRKADPRGVQCRFTDVAPGAYAVSVFHDANGNRRLDTNLIGIPSEDWGMSNNIRPAMRAPTFAESRIDVAATGRAIEVRLAP